MPTDSDTQKRDGEANTSSRTAEGPKRDKRPEHAYPAAERQGGQNRTDTDAPSGPVNIPVKP